MILSFFFQSGLLDSNQRPRAPQTCVLPTALNPDPFYCLALTFPSNAGAKVHRIYELTKFYADFLLFFPFLAHFSMLLKIKYVTLQPR